MKPEKFAEENNINYKSDEMVKGVSFSKFVENGEEVYYYLSQEGNIEGPPLKQVGHSGNKTYGVLRDGSRAMVDDEPPYVHVEE